jgi:quinol monooxygenase YgiN
MSRIAVVARIKAKSEFADYVKEQFLSLVEPTLNNDEGCINYDLHRDNDDPSLLYFLENWESRELLDRHSGSDHVQTCLKNTEGKIEELQINILTKIS